MFRLRLYLSIVAAALSVVLTACDPAASPSRVSTATPEPSPELTLTKVMDIFTHGQPDDPLICADADAAEFRAVPDAPAGGDWAVIADHQFSDDWAVGQHNYTLWFEPCTYAGELPDHLTVPFTVMASAPLRETPVYFGPLGVGASSNVQGPFLESIHPAQTVIARVADIQLTEATAQAVMRECRTWISIDGNNPRYLLMPHKPCNYAAR